ncbi:TPA: DUF551 domain-containing protein [Klebsiella aerogenes]|nr:DUF551 domain-containing protein [Klebsiella aerogenes]
MMLNGKCEPRIGFGEGWNACRAAMLQAEPVTTANKLPFEQWLSQQTGTIDVECGCVMTEVFFHWLRVAYEAGNSPVIPDTWIPVSERMPERGDYLVTDGCDFDVQLFNGEEFIPGFVWEDKITHWMPLPAVPPAPIQENI